MRAMHGKACVRPARAGVGLELESGSATSAGLGMTGEPRLSAAVARKSGEGPVAKRCWAGWAALLCWAATRCTRPKKRRCAGRLRVVGLQG
jgi:hypothetical protein